MTLTSSKSAFQVNTRSATDSPELLSGTVGTVLAVIPKIMAQFQVQEVRFALTSLSYCLSVTDSAAVYSLGHKLYTCRFKAPINFWRSRNNLFHPRNPIMPNALPSFSVPAFGPNSYPAAWGDQGVYFETLRQQFPELVLKLFRLTPQEARSNDGLQVVIWIESPEVQSGVTEEEFRSIRTGVLHGLQRWAQYRKPSKTQLGNDLMFVDEYLRRFPWKFSPMSIV